VIVMERASNGEQHPLDLDAWAGPATELERNMLAGLRAAVLDVGCGPGRIAAALAEEGVPALGIDVSPTALRSAQLAGAIVLERSIFDPLPGEGRWGTVLLLDGNVGIGGDPVALLRRARELAHADGDVVVEVDPPGRSLVRDAVRLRSPNGDDSPWFGWAWVGADAVAEIARQAGFASCDVQRHGPRFLARLHGAPR
jgi:SAM-dependent methyltransferase